MPEIIKFTIDNAHYILTHVTQLKLVKFYVMYDLHTGNYAEYQEYKKQCIQHSQCLRKLVIFIFIFFDKNTLLLTTFSVISDFV